VNPQAFMNAQLVALELIRRAIANLPLAIAANAGRAAAQNPATGGQGSGLANAMRAAALGTAYNPYPLPPPPPPPVGRGRQLVNFLASNQVTRAAGAMGNNALAGLKAAAGALAARFGQLIGPVAALTAITQAQTSGFSVLGKTMQLLGATLAPIILPLATTLAVGLLKMSDMLSAKIIPALEGFYSVVMNTLLPAVDGFISVFSGLVDVIAWIRRNIPGLGNDEGTGTTARRAGQGAAIGGIVGAFGGPGGAILGAGLGAAGGAAIGLAENILRSASEELFPTRNRASGSGGVLAAAARSALPQSATPATPATSAQRRQSQLDDIVRELRLSMGPQASIQGIGSVRNQALTAALNAGPIEQRMLRIAEQTLNAMERVAANTTPAVNGSSGWGGTRPSNP